MTTENKSNLEQALEANIELIAERVHDAWWDGKKADGFHPPSECDARTGDEMPSNGRFCDKCHPDMIPYPQLPEGTKEYDRVTARTTIQTIAGLVNEGHIKDIPAGSIV